MKTQKAIDDCLGGVMFIDEAYSLGSSGNNADKSDSFSKECIDTLNQNLSEQAGKFVCIIAGYSDELDKYFFSVNEGLKRRFPFSYTIDKYSHIELAKIFNKKVLDCNWKLDKQLFDKNISEQLIEFMKQNYKDLPNYAGDIETLLFNIKLIHGYRIFGKCDIERKNITFDDLKNGFELFKKSKNQKDKDDKFIHSMYC
jgi:hypothetical protein